MALAFLFFKLDKLLALAWGFGSWPSIASEALDFLAKERYLNCMGMVFNSNISNKYTFY